jgi:hypothetical protein
MFCKSVLLDPTNVERVGKSGPKLETEIHPRKLNTLIYVVFSLKNNSKKHFFVEKRFEILPML